LITGRFTIPGVAGVARSGKPGVPSCRAKPAAGGRFPLACGGGAVGIARTGAEVGFCGGVVVSDAGVAGGLVGVGGVVGASTR